MIEHETVENTGTIYGYARVSKQKQNLETQVDMLIKAGVDKKNIFMEKIISVKEEKPMFDKLMEKLKPGDVLIFPATDRISRSVLSLLPLVQKLGERGINLKSLKEGWIDTTSPMGKFLFTIFAGLAEMERNNIRERTRDALETARARGRIGGRKKIQVNDPKVLMAKEMNKNKALSTNEICKTLKISRTSFYRYVNM